MRASELLFEYDYQERLEGDLNDLLIAGKAAGIKSVALRQLVAQLRELGHYVSEDSLLSDLETIEFISVSNNKVSFVDDEGGTLNDNDVERNRDIVRNLASKSATQSIKS